MHAEYTEISVARVEGPLLGLTMTIVLAATDDVAIVFSPGSVQVYGVVAVLTVGYQYYGIISPGLKFAWERWTKAREKRAIVENRILLYYYILTIIIIPFPILW